jgi:hypothetical protein
LTDGQLRTLSPEGLSITVAPLLAEPELSGVTYWYVANPLLTAIVVLLGHTLSRVERVVVAIEANVMENITGIPFSSVNASLLSEHPVVISSSGKRIISMFVRYFITLAVEVLE